MEDKKLAGGPLGSFGTYDVSIKSGAAVGTLRANLGEYGTSALQLNFPLAKVAGKFLRPLFAFVKEKIPGHFEDGILDELEKKLSALSPAEPAAEVQHAAGQVSKA